ncbi:hypothetical protein B2J88_26950 [Rhodococcus sp. SRB_17]|nr:hypothetical protein [Rhodococcus sp. SRB_17]
MQRRVGRVRNRQFERLSGRYRWCSLRRLGDILDVLMDLPLIAHIAAFDIGALREVSAAESMS